MKVAVLEKIDWLYGYPFLTFLFQSERTKIGINFPGEEWELLSFMRHVCSMMQH